jgi:Fe-S-cluster containining protein
MQMGRHPDRDALLDELRGLYHELDAMYAGATCPGTTECCRFGVTGRQPYLTSIEATLVRRALAERGFGERKLPRWKPLPLVQRRDERPCPLLDASGRCSVYRVRPFGCRTFYCERATSELPKRVDLQPLLRRLQALAARYEPGGERGRPLERIFDSASAAGSCRPRSGGVAG